MNPYSGNKIMYYIIYLDMLKRLKEKLHTDLYLHLCICRILPWLWLAFRHTTFYNNSHLNRLYRNDIYRAGNFYDMGIYLKPAKYTTDSWGSHRQNTQEQYDPIVVVRPSGSTMTITPGQVDDLCLWVRRWLERPVRAQKARPHIGQAWAGAVVEVAAAWALCATRFCCTSAVRRFSQRHGHLWIFCYAMVFGW